MRFRDRPLLVDGVDASLYLERPELEQRLIEPLVTGRNVLLLGEPGSGKSTLLRRTASLLEDRNRPAVIINAALADDARALLDLISAALDQRLGGTDNEIAEESRGEAAQLLGAVRRLRRDTAVAILVDGLIDADVGYDTFGRLRDELWTLGHAWVVAVRPRDSGALRTPPADAFWATVVEIPPLDYEETERLLHLGLNDEERRIVDRDRPISGAHPRYVIRAAEDVLKHGSGFQERSAADGNEHILRAALLGRSEAMAITELMGLGRPVSAHDPELSERLGWSRPYAQRILSHLEQQGLLRSILERSHRPGRPRKLYELNPDLPPR